MYIASSNGLGLYTINNHVNVSGCSFINNTAYYGGALCLGGYNHLEVSNLTFTENAALDSGGAIFADESNEMSLETCNVVPRSSNSLVICYFGNGNRNSTTCPKGNVLSQKGLQDFD